MKMTVFWDVMPCSLIEVYPRALMMKAVNTSETSVNFYQTTRRNNPEAPISILFKVARVLKDTNIATMRTCGITLPSQREPRFDTARLAVLFPEIERGCSFFSVSVSVSVCVEPSDSVDGTAASSNGLRSFFK
jgi:hypothetical protein